LAEVLSPAHPFYSGEAWCVGLLEDRLLEKELEGRIRATTLVFTGIKMKNPLACAACVAVKSSKPYSAARAPKHGRA